MLVDFKRDETQKNREHNIQMAQVFTNAMMRSYDHLCYLTGQSIQMANSRLVRESSFHDMLYLLLSPLLTILRQHSNSSLTSNNQIMMQWSTPTILAILNVRNIAEESKNNHFSRDILLFYDF